MNELTSCDGRELKGMFSAATRWLERSAQSINTLNVFPVPDGDTGTNMLLTMRAAMEEVSLSTDGDAASIANAMAKGTLMGARGNSGVILSQIFRGLAKGMDGKRSFNGSDLADSLAQSSLYAYKGMSKPVEGTILTVIREAADAALARSAGNDSDVLAIMEAVVDEARESVARTPSLLPVLRQAGVVDAGGQGLFVLLEGALRYLRGDLEEGESAPPEPAAIPVMSPAEEDRYGYCTEFLLEGKGLDAEAIREKLTGIGESVLVVGDDAMVRAHVHTFDPGAALSYATSLGTLKQVKVENMDEQHRDFIVAQTQPTAADISIVAVVSGKGLTDAFYSIGATIVVPGGETMNPSVQELLQAVESSPSDNAVILPNNPNILLAAKQVPDLTRKKVEIVPAKTVPQGIAALLAFNPEATLEENAAAMKSALSTVRTGEVTTAVRSMEIDGFSVKQGQAIAFLDRKPVAAEDSMSAAVLNLLSRISIDQDGLVTIFYGANTYSGEAEKIAEVIRERYTGQEIEVVAGGQPHYDYIISVE